MKPVYKLSFFLIMLFAAFQVSAQRKKSANVTVCNTILPSDDASMTSENTPLVLYIQDSATNQKIAIVFKQYFLKKMSYNPRKKLVNQKVCISGVIKTYNHQPAIFIYKEKQITLPEKAEVNKISSNG